MNPPRQSGSRRTRRYYRHAWKQHYCGCWCCAPGKVKKALAVRDKRLETSAIAESLEAR